GASNPADIKRVDREFDKRITALIEHRRCQVQGLFAAIDGVHVIDDAVYSPANVAASPALR
ncbi:MAG: hypothetical protein JF606_29565, partial [Burkholderiales bacterium]|nr:hypothetical protein [Burkholderiales bacterium]